jgi:hypothetical protein
MAMESIIKNLLNAGSVTKPNEYSTRHNRLDLGADPPVYHVQAQIFTDEMNDFDGDARVYLSNEDAEKLIADLLREARSIIRIPGCTVFVRGEERFSHSASWGPCSEEHKVDLELEIKIVDGTIRIADNLNFI